MTVTIDGQVVRTIPISMGRDETITVDGKEISFVTPSGIYVAQEKFEVKQMNSSTYGLPTSYDLGYDSAIPLAVRLSNSGIFAHSAPWSVADQGGCSKELPADVRTKGVAGHRRTRAVGSAEEPHRTGGGSPSWALARSAKNDSGCRARTTATAPDGRSPGNAAPHHWDGPDRPPWARGFHRLR
ncbi:MAG TPA: L,D-transpeptidase [Nakamurella sp.]|nr:L,D-transpeptidase [Nakamurella sp.]